MKIITSVNCEEKVNASLRLILQQSKKSKSFLLLCLLKFNYLMEMDNPDCESKKGFGASAVYLLCFKNRILIKFKKKSGITDKTNEKTL
jgi:hypothetical protein